MICLARFLERDFHQSNAAFLPKNVHWLISKYSWTQLIWTWLFQIPCYFKLTTTFLGFTLSHLLSVNLKLLLFQTIFVSPKSWKERGSTVKKFGYTTYRSIKRSVNFLLEVAFICFVMKDVAENLQFEPFQNSEGLWVLHMHILVDHKPN